MLRRALLSIGLLLLLVSPPTFGQCNLKGWATEDSPGSFLFHTEASGSWGSTGGEVRLWWGGGEAKYCPSSPCVYEAYLDIICVPKDLSMGATCFDANGAGVGQGGIVVHAESNHQPSISADSATMSPTTGFYSQFRIHAPAAWSDRFISFKWLPDMIDGGWEPINEQVPTDFTRGRWQSPPPGQTHLKATIWSCRDKSATAIVAARANSCCCQSTPTAPACVAQPIGVATGNMRMTDSDPLPAAVVSLARTYDSTSADVSGRFGAGWRSFLDPILKSATAAEGTYVTVNTGDTVYIFQSTGGVYGQVWPANGTPATLLYDGAAGTFTLHEPLRDVEVVARASDGVPLKYHSRSSGRDVIVTYSGALPAAVADSWGNWSWTLSTDAATGRITAVTADGTTNVWQYTYDTAGRLTQVRGPDNATWRTYGYGAYGLTEARDAAGRLIESHAYGTFYGLATQSLSDQGDVTSMTYGLAGDPLETGTRVTYATGASTLYYTRWIAGRPRTTRIVGSCSGCGTNDATYAYDDNGNIVREQDARGYVSTRLFDGLGRVTSSTAGYKPAGCDPETDASHCRLASPALATAALDPLASTVATTYSYGDTYWLDRPTQVVTQSVANPQQSRAVSYTYDATTGTVVREQIDGWKNATEQESIVSTTALYDGIAVAAFNPGGNFDPAWLSLPQPAGMKQALDGPRTDVADVTQWVYYPIDASVPALLRGHLAAVRDAAGNVTRFEAYDAFGNATRVVDPNGVATESAYDASGRPLTTTLKGVPGCDTSADPLCATDIVTQRSYSPPLGPLASETLPNGGTTTYEYDDRRRMTATTRAVSATAYERAEYDYDAATGKRSAERYKSGAPGSWTLARSEAFAYDIYARLREIDHPDGTKIVYTYDPAGNVATLQDERHTTPNTTYAYDPLNRLATVRQTLSTASAGTIVTQYGYDTAGNVTSVIDPNGNTTSYAFDDLGRLRSQASPVTGTTSYLYDPAGNLTSSTDANGATTARTYDALGRATSATSTRPGRLGETVTWTYGNASSSTAGRLLEMTDPSGSTNYSYERRGLITSESKSLLYATFTTNYGYDPGGNRTTLTYPANGDAVEFVSASSSSGRRKANDLGGVAPRTLTLGYDLAGRPISASFDGTPIVTAAAYRPFGPAGMLSYGNGTTRTATYDNRYRLLENKLAAVSGTIADYTYTHDAAGNVVSIHDAMSPVYNRDFAYDDLGRLITANTGAALWGSGGYNYDSMGNVLSLSLGAGTPHPRVAQFQYQGTSPKLLSVTTNGSTVPVGYDAAGNETSYVYGRGYSAGNHWIGNDNDAIPDPFFNPTRIYDGRGVRVETVSDLTLHRFSFYSPELHLLSRFEHSYRSTPLYEPPRGNPQFLGDFLWFGTEPVAQTINDNGTSTIRYTFTDHLGTPILQTSAAGAVVWRAEYEPFGSVYSYRAGDRDDPQILRLPGQELTDLVEDGTDQTYNIFRWYRSGWGRYTQPDPMGLNGGLNLYAYAEDTPINETDALGLSSRKARCIKWASNISGALEEARHHKNSGQSPRDPCGMLRRYLPKFAEDNCDVYFPMHGWLAKNYIDRFCGDPPKCQTEPEDDFWKRLADWLDHARRWMNKHTPGLPPLPAPAPGPIPGPMPFPEPLPIPIP